MVTSIQEVYARNMQSLINEIGAYNNETVLWSTAPGILNSAGNLALHLAGNLQFFMGTYLGNTGYVRDRDKEFSDKNVPQQTVIELLRHTHNVIQETLSGLRDDQMNDPYPIDKFGEGKTIGYVLNYLLAHLNYHLGQINYHRRLLSK